MTKKTEDTVAAYILQEEIPPELYNEMLAQGGSQNKLPVPKTIAIPTAYYGWMKKFSLEHLLGQSSEEVSKKIFVPEDKVQLWGLKEGDKVRYARAEGLSSIFEVNGFSDPQEVRNRSRLISDIHSSYAKRRIPIENVKLDKPGTVGAPDSNIINRAFTILSPLPEGGRIIIASPPTAGKSTVLRAVYEALLHLLEFDKKLFVIVLQVGERPEDATELEKIRDRVTHDKNRSEIFMAPAGNPIDDPLEGHYRLAKFAKARAERVCEGSVSSGFKVVLLIDSLSRVMMSHSFSDKIEKPKMGALSQGLNPKSLTDTISLLNVAGDFGDRSLTIITTLLKADDINLKRRTRSAEHVLFEQSGPSISIAIWGLVNSNNLALKPSIDLDVTFTRQFHEISTPGQIQEREFVINKMWNSPFTGKEVFRSSAEKALATILQYARDNPSYNKTQFAADYDKIQS